MDNSNSISNETPVDSFYIIVCGMFKYDLETINHNEFWSSYTHWQNRVNGGNYQATFDYFNSSYYDGYLNNVFPEIRHDKSSRDNLDSRFLNHLTNKSFLQNHLDIGLIINDKKIIHCSIEFADLIFSLKAMGFLQ